METTFVLIKPDGIKRNLIGNIISIYEQKGLVISQMKMIKPERSLMETHYDNLKEKPFFKSVVDYMSENYSIALLISGKDAIDAVRKINGLTDPLKADLGSIRGKFGIDVGRNLVHGSEDKENAEREIKLWFGTEKGMEWKNIWVYE